MTRHDATHGSSLLAGARRLDPDAWERLVRLYGPFVHAICRRRLGHEEDARDVAQQVFQSIAQDIDRFRPERGTFRGWVATIATRRALDHQRRAGRRPRLAHGSTAARRVAEARAPAPDSSDEIGVLPAERRALFRRALDLVRPRVVPTTWTAFWETAVEGRAAADVAADLGMTAGAVRVARSRVLSRLRDELGDGDVADDGHGGPG